MSSGVNKRQGKPQVQLYRPGSGPLKKSAFGEEDSYVDKAEVKNDRNNFGRYKKDNSDYRKFDTLSDDFDKLSVCSNSSRKKYNSANQNLSGSVGNLSCERRRTKKPEAAIYVPPKPPNSIQANNDNKRYLTRNYNNSNRSDSMKRDVGVTGRDSFKRDCDSSRRDGWSDSRSLEDEPEPHSGRENNKSKNIRPTKSKRRNGRNQNKDNPQVNGNKVEKIIPLMDIKFDCNPLKGKSNSFDTVGQETSNYTTMDGESERDLPYSRRETNTLPNRGVRQASEPRSSSLNSIQVDNFVRDSRSVEPEDDSSWNQDRFNQKPPLGSFGRRGNKHSHSKYKQHLVYESLPPRLQKKYLEENGFQGLTVNPSYPSLNISSNPDLSYYPTDEHTYSGPMSTSYLVADSTSNYINNHHNYIGSAPEDPWDGSSVTFQGSNPHYPPPSMHSQPQPAVWSQTLPNVRARGRGRIPLDELERERIAFEEARMRRSLTPNAFEGTRTSESLESVKTELLESEDVKEKVGIVTDGDNDGKKPVRNDSEKSTETSENNISETQEYENTIAVNKQKSPVIDLSFKAGIGMSWADEVELSERLQETLEEKESEDNSISLPSNNVVNHPATVVHRERRRRRKRSTSRDDRHTNDRRRRSVDVEEPHSMSRSRKNSSNDDRNVASRSRKNSCDDRNVASRSRKNSCDDRSWPRSRKDSGDDRNWRRDENRDPFENYRHNNRNNSRHNSRNNSRNNSAERWTNEEYHRFNGSEWKFRGNAEQFRRGSNKSYNNPSDKNFGNQGRRRGSRDRSIERQKDQTKQEENWREEARRLNGPESAGELKKVKKPAGILILPQSTSPNETSNKHARNMPSHHTQKQLFDPSNPQRPLIVKAPSDSGRMTSYAHYNTGEQIMSPDGQFVVPMAPPVHVMRNPSLLKEAEVIDYELNRLLMSNSWYEYHDDITKRRARLQEILWVLLTSDLKFCKQENMESYFWKILYYNLLEWLRKQMGAAPQNRENYLGPLLNIIDEGMKFFENTLKVLEDSYKFRLEDYLSVGMSAAKGEPLLTLALHSAQKILLFLGDLARYRETVQETTNYGVARQWYMKAQQLNPKNGRPYNQLAILAFYARRMLEAVYYYMRSLIAATPVTSSKENLITLFDENRKKYEISEKQRQEERELKNKEKMKEKEFESKKNMQLRREIWIHPEGGRRVHRTTSTSQAMYDDSEAELEALSHLDLSKRFSMSFLHVHGKLFSKIGMESFNSAAVQMLRELRVLLQHSPLALNSTRLLHLLALNMFAIDNTQLKTSELGPGYRSVLQESALVTSLQMFDLLLERAVQLLKDQQAHSLTYKLIVSEDVNVLLPAIKVWCDWLLCHSAVWNPPPSCHDYRVGSAGDVWGRLATLVNLLEKLDYPKDVVSETCQDGFVQVRLPEDSTLTGFLPLLFLCSNPMYTSKETNMEVAQVSLRIHKILFCGTEFLCGVDPPVLKLHKNEFGLNEYISVVETPSPPNQSDGELCVESVSGGDSEDSGQASEEEGEGSPSISGGGGEIQSLLQRKHELERSHRLQEKHRQKVQNILQSSMVSVEIEVRPHYLVADTNCFIDYLPQLQVIARASSPTRPHIYTLMVPLVVLNELDGLAHGRRDSSARPEHLAMVTECAASALEFLRSRPSPAIRCVTTKGTILNSATFTSEEDCQDLSNDDKILTTCLKLCHSSTKEQVEGQPRKISREVVLLTEDRNLRVKAIARDVPVREVPDFLLWAGLGLG